MIFKNSKQAKQKEGILPDSPGLFHPLLPEYQYYLIFKKRKKVEGGFLKNCNLISLLLH